MFRQVATRLQARWLPAATRGFPIAVHPWRTRPATPVAAAIQSQSPLLRSRDFGSYAPLNSPTFTGNPAAPTPTAGDNSINLATTAYLDRQLGANNGIATLDGGGHLTAGQIPASLVGAVVYQGVWNASTNTPALASGVGTKGSYYKVSVAGTTSIDGVASWESRRHNYFRRYRLG